MLAVSVRNIINHWKIGKCILTIIVLHLLSPCQQSWFARPWVCSPFTICFLISLYDGTGSKHHRNTLESSVFRQETTCWGLFQVTIYFTRIGPHYSCQIHKQLHRQMWSKRVIATITSSCLAQYLYTEK